MLLVFCISFDATFARKRGSSDTAQQLSNQSESTQSWVSRLKVFFSRYFIQPKSTEQDSKNKKSNNMETEKKFGALCIFLDDTETNMLGAVSWGFLKALYHKACPIIVTQSLMNNILTCRSLNRGTLILKYAWDLFKSRKNASVIHPALQKIISSDITFHDRDWIIKKIGEFGYLLIPKQYSNYSGLNLEPFQVVTSQNILDIQYVAKDQNQDVSAYEEKFLSSLSGQDNQSDYIFLKNSIKWTIFIQGHGRQEREDRRRIAGLSFEGYKKFLQAMEHVGCRLLISDSCYGGGVNARLVYGDNTYPYDIILHGIGDTVTWESVGPSTVYSEHSNFKNFVDFVMQREIDYEKVILSISDPRLNVSMIKRSNSEKFEPLFKNVFVISEGAVQSDDEKIVVPKEHTVLLIELENIEKEIALNSSELQAIFMLHTKPVNNIKKITSKIEDIEVIKAFMAMDGFEDMTLKIINVFEINKLKDVLIWYNPVKKIVQAFYKKDGKNFYIQKPQGYVDIKKLVAREVDEGVKKDRAKALMIEYNLKNHKPFNFNIYKHIKLLSDFVSNKGLFDLQRINEKDEYGNTVLHIAAQDGDVEKLSELLAPNFNDINPVDKFIVKNQKGQTPLHLAVLNNRVQSVKKILELAKAQFITKKDRERLLEEKDKSNKRPRDYVQCNKEINDLMDTFIEDDAPKYESGLEESSKMDERY